MGIMGITTITTMAGGIMLMGIIEARITGRRFTLMDIMAAHCLLLHILLMDTVAHIMPHGIMVMDTDTRIITTGITIMDITDMSIMNKNRTVDIIS